MKKIAMSIVASSMLFAGGDIPPVEVSEPAQAEFWGQIGFAYQFQDENHKIDGDFGDKENNAFSTTIVLGVQKELGNGFGLTAEVSGWSDFGLDIANNPRVDSSDATSAEITQAYLSYATDSFAVKAGRQALPASISPWAWTDTTAGVADWTYDGVTVANTDLADTTLVAAWISATSRDSSERAVISDDAGLFMLAAINKSFSDTVISLNGYYIPDSELNILTGYTTQIADTWSVWGSVVTKTGDIDLGIQGAFVDGDVDGWDSTYGVAIKAGTSWGDLYTELRAGYINDGDYRLAMAGAGTGVEDSSFWTDIYDISGDTYGAEQWSIQARVKYSLQNGSSLYGAIGYWDFDDHPKWGDEDNAWSMHAGYKFKIFDTNAKLEYRYRNFEYYHSADRERQRVRIEAYYKF
jgi:hypothetical protein